MTRPRIALGAALTSALVLLAACGGDGPTTPSVVSVVFEPAERSLTRGALQPVELRVHTQDGAAVTATFWLDGAEVATGPSYTWPADLPGTHELKAVAEHGGRSYTATWVVEVTDTGALPTPAVTEIHATLGPLPGTAVLAWEAPPASLYTIPLQDYVVGVSLAPIVDLQSPGVQTTVVLHQGASIVHQLQRDGLQERALYYFRVQVRDTFGRFSALSPQASSEATGHYDVRGTVLGMRPNAPAVPLDAVLVAMGPDHKQVTGGDGRYGLLNLPDIFLSRLSLQDTRLEFYSLAYPTLPTVDQECESLLFERGVVHVVLPDGEGDWSRLQFLREFTQRTGPVGNPIYRWASYPVAMYAAPYVNEYGVDYRASVLRAIDVWNTAAGDQLLVAVDDFNPSTDIGAYYTANISDGEGRIGETKMVDPPGPLRSAVPRLIRIELVSFHAQATADLIIAHEVGHVLLLGHSPSADQLMNSVAPATSGGIPTPAEVYAARLLAHFPQGVDLAMFADPPPAAVGSR